MPSDTQRQPVQVLLPGRRSLLVRLNCKPGFRPALLDVLNTYTDGLAEEPGTEVFVVSLDPDASDTVWLYEVFKDEQAQVAHQAASGFADMMQAMPPLLEGPPAVLRLDPLRMSMQEALLTEDWGL